MHDTRHTPNLNDRNLQIAPELYERATPNFEEAGENVAAASAALSRKRSLSLRGLPERPTQDGDAHV